jgi:hypothetical protein
LASEHIDKAKECCQIREAEIQRQGQPAALRFTLLEISDHTEQIKDSLKPKNALKQWPIKQEEVADEESHEERSAKPSQ